MSELTLSIKLNPDDAYVVIPVTLALGDQKVYESTIKVPLERLLDRAKWNLNRPRNPKFEPSQWISFETA